jgi:uncharacterized SAM-binding protein YcdF (DUF218 family)
MSACGVHLSRARRLAGVIPVVKHLIPRLPVRMVACSCLLLGGAWAVGTGGWSIFAGPAESSGTPAFGERNAIVLLSAGSERAGPDNTLIPTHEAMSRIKKTAAEYMACKAARVVCSVIVSGGDPDANGAADADVYRPELEAIGVDPADLILERRSLNTYENASYVKPILHDGRYDSVVLVTSSYHMRRAELVFNHLGMNVTPESARADGLRPSLLPRRNNFRIAWRTFHEFAGVMQLRVYSWAGIY